MVSLLANGSEPKDVTSSLIAVRRFEQSARSEIKTYVHYLKERDVAMASNVKVECENNWNAIRRCNKFVKAVLTHLELAAHGSGWTPIASHCLSRRRPKSHRLVKLTGETMLPQKPTPTRIGSSSRAHVGRHAAPHATSDCSSLGRSTLGTIDTREPTGKLGAGVGGKRTEIKTRLPRPGTR